MTKLSDGWEIKRLDEIADVVMGQSPPGSSYNEHGVGQPFFQGKTEFGEVHPTVRKYTTAGTKFAKAGDILMSVRAPVGPTNIADIDCVIGRGLAAIRAKSVVSQSYLRWTLKHLEIDIQSKGTGTTFDAITGETLRGTLIALPPLAEQHKIVELLEDHLLRLEAALVDVKQAKIKAAQFRRSILQAAFTGNLGLGESSSPTELPDGWEIKRLEDLCEPGRQAIVDGPFGSNLKRSDYEDSGIPVLKIQNIKENVITLKKMDYVKPEKYQELVRHSFTEGDIVMTKLGDPLGVSAIVTGIPNGLIVADLVRIRPSKVLTKFLCYQLNSPRIQKYINEQQKGTTRPRVNLAMIRELPIYSPPIDEQHKIVELLEDHLSRLDASVSLADAMEKQSNALRRSLLQAAFTGQLTNEVVSV